VVIGLPVTTSLITILSLLEKLDAVSSCSNHLFLNLHKISIVRCPFYKSSGGGRPFHLLEVCKRIVFRYKGVPREMVLLGFWNYLSGH
jgi:hypothetical protein